MEETIINGEALCASTEGVLVIEQYLQENYLFRRNVLNGKVEYATKNAEGVCSDWRPLTLEAQNSIVLRVLREGILEKGNPKDLIKLGGYPSFAAGSSKADPVEEQGKRSSHLWQFAG